MKKLLVLAALAGLAGCQSLPSDFRSLTMPASQTTPGTAAAASASAGAYITPEQELLEADRALAALASQRGLGVALAETVDPTDGFVLTDQGALRGATAIAPTLNAVSAAGPVFWQAEQAFIAKSGDMGMTSGSFVQVLPGAEAGQGRYVTVWRKDAEGRWRVLADVPVAKKPPPKAAAVAATPAKKK